MSKSRVRMADIAARLGVSNVTISKALGDKDGVSEEMRAKIKELAAQLGYRYKAKAEAEGSTYTIGILVADHFVRHDSSFYWSLYQLLIESLKIHGYFSMLEIVKQEDADSLVMPHFIGDSRVDGIAVLGYLSGDYLAALSVCGLPLVTLDYYNEELAGVSAVVTDGYLGSYRLASYLHKLGHKNIGFVGSKNATSSIQDRFLGYCKALITHGLDYRADWIIEDRENLEFIKNFVLPEQMPTAFVCNCDETAFNFIAFLNSKGYSVPEDVSIVGFYNYIYATLCTPQLTTMDIDCGRMAETAVEVGLRMMHSETAVEVVRVEGHIIERDSVKDLRRKG